MRKVKSNGGTLNVMEKGETLNPNGRPRKITTQLKHEGYKRDEVRRTINKMMAMNNDEIIELSKNKDITVLERGILRMIDNFFRHGKPELMEYMIPKAANSEEKQMSISITNELPKDPIEASKAYQELMK